MPAMGWSESSGEMAVFPWVVNVIVGVIPSGIVTHPLIALVDVGNVGGPLLIAEVPLGLRRLRRAVKWRRPSRRRLDRMADGAGCVSLMLREYRHRNDEQC